MFYVLHANSKVALNRWRGAEVEPGHQNLKKHYFEITIDPKVLPSVPKFFLGFEDLDL